MAMTKYDWFQTNFFEINERKPTLKEVEDFADKLADDYRELEFQLEKAETKYLELMSMLQDTQRENIELGKDLVLAREGLEFYSKQESWDYGCDINENDYWTTDHINYPNEHPSEWTVCGGKKAREILSQLDKKGE